MASSTDLRLLLPKAIWLESEQFAQAKAMSDRLASEACQWQAYLNALACLSFADWFGDRMSHRASQGQIDLSATACHFTLDGFKFVAIATEQLLDEVVNLPSEVVEKPELTAHFYVVLEVLEEQEQAIVRGFLSYNDLISYCHQLHSQPSPHGYYQLPIELFDAEPNRLLTYCRYLEPAAIPLPVAATVSVRENSLQQSLERTSTKLSQWLQGIVSEGWQAIDTIVNLETNLAFGVRNLESGSKRGKLINLGMQLRDRTVALLVNVSQEAEGKVAVLVQIHPIGGERFLPPKLRLTLLSKAKKVLQEVTSRSEDNYIQLGLFKGEPGKRFSIQVQLENIRLEEDFEL